MRWNVPPFGWNCSCYFTFIMLSRALELCIGDHNDTKNPFHWHHVQFNFPYTTGYDPRLPHVRLISFNGEVVVRVIFFFDYGRVYVLRAERVQSGLRQICAGLKFLGNQEAAWKRTAGVQRPRAWCGYVCILTIIYRRNS